jgi:hypothetical protein
MRMGASWPRDNNVFSAALLSACLLLSLPGCQPPQAPARPTVSLRMRGTPPDAAVVIDDEAIGPLDFVAAHGVALPPGVHHVTVQAMGYLPWDREVSAEIGAAPIVLEVALTPVPD